MVIKKKTLQIIGAIILFLIIALIGGFAVRQATGQSGMTSPAKINEIAENIVDFELPAGYSPTFGITENGKSLVIYSKADVPSRIVILQDEQTTSLLNEQALRDYLDQNNQDVRWLQNEEPLAAKGFPIGVASTSRGYAADGTPYIHTIVPFMGKNGGAVISIESTADNWDVNQVRALLDSLSIGS